jgi:hypothetical protein
MPSQPIVLHGDPDDPFASPEDIIRILRLMGERNERKLRAFRHFLENPSAQEWSWGDATPEGPLGQHPRPSRSPS